MSMIENSRQLHQLAWSLAIGSDHARPGDQRGGLSPLRGVRRSIFNVTLRG